MTIYERTRVAQPTDGATLQPTDDAEDLPPAEETEDFAAFGAEMAGEDVPAENPFIDASSGLIDELERILHDDFAEPEEEPAAFDHFADAGFPLAEPEPLDEAEPQAIAGDYDEAEDEASSRRRAGAGRCHRTLLASRELDARTAPPLPRNVCRGRASA